MRPHLNGIDHVVILAKDLDAAQDTFTRMGFHSTPRGHHSIGTQNHCLMLQRDYVELLSVVRPHPVTQYFADFLARREGLAAMAFSTDDADAAYAALRSAGIAADEPVDFSRPVQTPDGSRDARFRVVQLPTEATPGMRTFICQHFTPEIVWLPEHVEHPLGALGIVGITIASANPGATASAYGALMDELPLQEPEAHVLQVGKVRLRFVEGSPGFASSPAAHGASVEALHLRIASSSDAEASLRAGRISYQRLQNGALSISAETACGVAIRLDPEATAPA